MRSRENLLLPPPKGHDSWLSFAVHSLYASTRHLYHDFLWGNQPQWPEDVQRDDFEAAAQAELAEMRALQTVIGWIKRRTVRNRGGSQCRR